MPDSKKEGRNNGRGRIAITRWAVLVVASGLAALGLSACDGPSPPHVASVGNSGGNQGSATTTLPTGNATAVADEWATCMRRHGLANQQDPVIDVHGVINIMMRFSSGAQAQKYHMVGGLGAQTGMCSSYLVAAQQVLRATVPYTPFVPDQALIVNYANCMRANGVANYPYPTPGNDKSSLKGIDPFSPTFIAANKVCGAKIGAPAWWINGWGPPGDVSVRSTIGSGPRPGVGANVPNGSIGG